VKSTNSLIDFCKIHYKTSYLLILIVVLAFILRIYDLSGESYWFDEFITLRYAQNSLDSIISTTRPRLFLIVAHFWIEFFGNSETATRLLSVFFGTASILLIYSIGKSLFGKTVGLLSAFFMSVSQFQIYYSQEFRYYSLFLLMSLISFFFYLRVLKTKSNIYTVLYVISTILLYFTQDFAIFVIVVQNLYFIINFKLLRSIIPTWLLSQIIIFLFILPGFITNFNNRVLGPDGPDWLKAPDIKTPAWTIYYYLGSGFDYPPVEAIVIAFVVLLTGVLIYISIIGKERWLESIVISSESLKVLKKIKSEILLVGIWLIFPLLMILMLSEFIKPMYHHRYLIFTSPALYIALALVLTKIKRIVPILIILITYVILISPGLYDYYSLPVKEQWRSVANYIVEHEKPGDLILYLSEENNYNLEWYFTGNSIPCIPNMDNISNMDQLSILQDCSPDVDRIWLLARKELSGPAKDSLLNLMKNSYVIVKEKEFTIRLESEEMPRIYYVGRLTLYLFEMAGKEL